MTFTDAELLVCLPMLGRFARKYRDGDDLVQDTCAKALRFREHYHGGSLDAWLIVMLRRIAASQAKHERRGFVVRRSAALCGLRQVAPEQEAATLARELTDSMVADDAFFMAARQYTYDDITAATGMPRATISDRLARTREIMRARC